MGWIEIVVIVLVAGLVLSRFFAFKLPTDTRSRAARKADFSKLFKRHIPAEPKMPLEEEPKAEKEKKKAAAAAVKKVSTKDLAGMSGIEKIKALEPGFSEKSFLEGARRAYAYFYKCWNAKDEDGLMALCAPRLVDAIATGWDKKWQEVKVEDVAAVTVGEARVSGRTAMVEAVIVAKRREGKQLKAVKSVWLLARPLGSGDSDWELQEMKEHKA